MNSDPASLDNLRDIVMPDPVSWWPLAAGWWVLIVIGSLAFVFGSWRAWRHWQENAYRREALEKLKRADSVAEVATLLKRTALGAYPRSAVASLTGAAWCRFLDQSSGESMPHDVSELLTRGVFMKESSEATESLRAYASTWVRRHRVESAMQSTRGRAEPDTVNQDSVHQDARNGDAVNQEASESSPC